jgi:hypothetical protein
LSISAVQPCAQAIIIPAGIDRPRMKVRLIASASID